MTRGMLVLEGGHYSREAMTRGMLVLEGGHYSGAANTRGVYLGLLTVLPPLHSIAPLLLDTLK